MYSMDANKQFGWIIHDPKMDCYLLKSTMTRIVWLHGRITTCWYIKINSNCSFLQLDPMIRAYYNQDGWKVSMYLTAAADLTRWCAQEETSFLRHLRQLWGQISSADIVWGLTSELNKGQRMWGMPITFHHYKGVLFYLRSTTTFMTSSSYKSLPDSSLRAHRNHKYNRRFYSSSKAHLHTQNMSILQIFHVLWN